MSQTALTDQDLTLTASAQAKMADLFKEVDDSIKGVRVFAQPGGCSGIGFGMTFADAIEDNDAVLGCTGFDVIVDSGTLQYLRGVEIDYVNHGAGNESFVFNNVPQPPEGVGGSACGGCSSSSGAGGGCS